MDGEVGWEVDEKRVANTFFNQVNSKRHTVTPSFYNLSAHKVTQKYSCFIASDLLNS